MICPYLDWVCDRWSNLAFSLKTPSGFIQPYIPCLVIISLKYQSSIYLAICQLTPAPELFPLLDLEDTLSLTIRDTRSGLGQGAAHGSNSSPLAQCPTSNHFRPGACWPSYFEALAFPSCKNINTIYCWDNYVRAVLKSLGLWILTIKAS